MHWDDTIRKNMTRCLQRMRVLVLAGAVLLSHLLVPPCLQSAETKIAVMMSSKAEPFAQTAGGFREFLARQGVQSSYEVITMGEDEEHAAAAVQRLKSIQPQLVLTVGAFATERTLNVFSEVPVVACLVLRTGDLKQHRNATGVGLEFPIRTQFDWIHRILPQARTVGVLYNPGENQEKIEAAAEIARSMGMRLEAEKVSAPTDVPGALNNISRRADVIWGTPDSITLTPVIAKNVLLFSFRQNIPFIGPSATWVKAGALYSLDWDYNDLGAQCGELAWKILNGTRPADLPVAAPRRVQYSVNLSTARQMKVAVSDEIVRGAQKKY